MKLVVSVKLGFWFADVVLLTLSVISSPLIYHDMDSSGLPPVASHLAITVLLSTRVSIQSNVSVDLTDVDNYEEYNKCNNFLYMKSFIAKRLNSILVNLRYLRFKLLKYKENNKKICNTFDHNFKNIPLYIMRKVSLERYYFVLYDCALTSKMSKMALKSFCDKTLHIILQVTFSKLTIRFFHSYFILSKLVDF